MGRGFSNDINRHIQGDVRSLREAIVADVRPVLQTLFLAVAVVLFIACVNGSSLLLVRAIRQRREYAVRIAIVGNRGQTGRNLSHQTPKFPPTPSIQSTSASHVRMIKLQYYTLTVIKIRTTIPHARGQLLMRMLLAIPLQHTTAALSVVLPS